MKTFLKVFFLSVVLVCLGALTLLSADAAVGTEAELQAAINAANAGSGSATTITLTGNVTVSADGTFTVNGKNIVIDGAGKYSITRATVNTEGDYLFEITNGSKVEFRNVTVDNNVYTFRMADGANSTLTLGAGATAKGKTTADFGDPIVVLNGSGNVFYLQAGATIQKDSTVDARSMLLKTAGTAHIYGALIDNTPGHSKNHRIIYGTGGTVNIYEGAVLTATNDGGNNNGTAMIWAGCTTLNIYGGTFTQTGWDADASLDKAPHGMIALFGGASAVANISGGTFVMGAADKTSVAVAPIFLSISGGTLNVTGGTFTQNYASPLFATYTGCVLKTLNITGGTFVQNGAANAFHFTVGSNAAITVGGNAKITNNYNTNDGSATGAGRIFHFAVPATLTVGGTAELTAFNSVVFSEGANITVTGKDNARFLTKHLKAWAFNFRSGTSVLTLQDNAYVRAGSYDAEGNSVGTGANSYGVVLLERDSKGGSLTVNMSGNAYIEAQNSGIYLDMDSVTDTAKACVLNLTGGTIISHQNFAINLKTKAIVSVSAIKNMKMDSYAACFNVETVTFTNSTLAFENCSMITRNTPTDTGAAVVRFGFSSVTPTGVTSISFTNCSLESSTYSLVIGPNSTSVTSVKFRTTGAGNYTLKGAISCAAKSASNPSNPSAVITFSVEGTGTVTMNEVTLTQPSTVNTITVTGAGTLTLTDCSFTQTGAAAALMKVSAAATVNVGGSTVLSNTASSRNYPAILLTADVKLNIYGTAQVNGVTATSAITTEKGAPTIRIYGTPTLNSDTYTFNFQGGSPVVSVEGGTLNGSYIVAYNNNGNYATAGGFITVNVSGGTFNPDVFSSFYIASNDAAKNTVTVTGGTFTSVANSENFNNVFTANGAAQLDINISGGDFTDVDRKALVAGFSTSKTTVTIAGGKFAGTMTNTSGSGKVTLIIKDGVFGTDTTGVAFATSGATVNIYGGLFKSAASHTLLVDNGASVTVFGGTFVYTGATGSAVQVGNTTNATSATLTVNGGAFRAPKSVSPVFVTNTDASVINLNSCTAMGNGTLFTDYGSYANSLNQTGTGAYTAHNALDLKNGATLRLVKGSAGLRFVTNVTKKAYDHYVGIADGGNVTFGTLIFPAKYAEWLDTYAGEYTKDALDALGLQYLNIAATSKGFIQNADGSYTMNAVIANIKDVNVELSFAALPYVTYTVDGITVTQYANHDAVKNERSIYQVARAAANDVSTTEQGNYVYEIMSNGNSAYVGKYSPYSAEQWTLIGKWWAWNNTTKAEVQTIDLYLIAGQSNAAGYTTIADDATFQSTHSAKTFPYVYYVGGMPRYTSVNSVIKLGVSTLTTATSMTVSKLGQGATPGKEFGAEFGMAEKLSAYYNATTGKKAAIVKYAVGGTSLSDFLSGNNNYGGNWASPSYLATKTAAGWQSGGLYRGFIHQVKSAVEDYRAMGFIVNIKGVFWMQGEADRTVTGINNAVTSSGSYRNMFKYLVEDMRADFYDMTPYNTDTVEVYVGEVAKYFGGNALAENTNFVAMQNTLDEISGLPGIHIIKSGDYKDFRNADKYHWNCASMYAIGQLVGNAMIANSMN